MRGGNGFGGLIVRRQIVGDFFFGGAQHGFHCAPVGALGAACGQHIVGVHTAAVDLQRLARLLFRQVLVAFEVETCQCDARPIAAGLRFNGLAEIGFVVAEESLGQKAGCGVQARDALRYRACLVFVAAGDARSK
jgi:hypothetical protein